MSDTIYHLELTEAGCRLDKALADRLPDLSRAQIQRLIGDGRVTVDGNTPARVGLRLKGGEVAMVIVPPARPTKLDAEPIPLRVIYEDDDLIVVDKQAGMVVHPSVGHEGGTLVNAIMAHSPNISGIGGESRPGIVHRLDKDTSGLILVAKNDRSYRFVQAQFKARTVEKRYIALVVGEPPTPIGRVEAGIGRDPKQRRRMAVLKGDRWRIREAITEYRTIESFDGFVLLNVKTLTGRTHQVRVHMAFLGCPLVGDRLYGKRCELSSGLQRHFLHAEHLRVKLLNGSEKRFSSPIPVELDTVLNYLRSVSSTIMSK